jgi:hypothetical protein
MMMNSIAPFGANPYMAYGGGAPVSNSYSSGWSGGSVAGSTSTANYGSVDSYSSSYSTGWMPSNQTIDYAPAYAPPCGPECFTPVPQWQPRVSYTPVQTPSYAPTPSYDALDNPIGNIYSPVIHRTPDAYMPRTPGAVNIGSNPYPPTMPSQPPINGLWGYTQPPTPPTIQTVQPQYAPRVQGPIPQQYNTPAPSYAPTPQAPTPSYAPTPRPYYATPAPVVPYPVAPYLAAAAPKYCPPDAYGNSYCPPGQQPSYGTQQPAYGMQASPLFYEHGAASYVAGGNQCGGW